LNCFEKYLEHKHAGKPRWQAVNLLIGHVRHVRGQRMLGAATRSLARDLRGIVKAADDERAEERQQR
jgi:hypothetical protein